MQRIGDDDAEPDAVVKDTAYKSDIQTQLKAASKSTKKEGINISSGGFIIWLDFTRKTVKSNDFLLERPKLLPNLERIGDELKCSAKDEDEEDDNDEEGKTVKRSVINQRAPAIKKLITTAKEIAAVCKSMLRAVQQRIVIVSRRSNNIPGKYLIIF